MLDLDSYETTVSIKYKGKVYKIKKLLEKEKGIQEEIQEALEKNDTSIYDKIRDFIIDRFVEADKEFPVEEFKEGLTLEMLVAIFGEISGIEKKKD